MKIKKILFVEDNDEILESACEFFERYGFEVRGAKDGFECFIKIDEFDPDLILLDINMSKMDGIDVIKTIESKYVDDKKVIVASKNIKPEYKEWLGGKKIPTIGRPIDYNLLLCLIEKLDEEDE